MSICIGPDNWVSLSTPTNMTVGAEQPAIRYEPVTGLYRLKGKFVATASILVSAWSASLPGGIAADYEQVYGTRAPVVPGNAWSQKENVLLFKTTGNYNIGLALGAGDILSFDGIELIASA